MGEELSIEGVIKRLNKRVEWMSLTGGEPMLEEDLVHLIKRLKGENSKILLETNDILFNNEVFMLCDFFSMDLRRPSRGNEGYGEDALSYCLDNPEKSQIKVVIQDEWGLIFFRKVYTGAYSNWMNGEA